MTPRTSCHRTGFRRTVTSVFLLLSGVLAVLGTSRPAAGQPGVRGLSGDRTVPTKTYHAAFGDFYDGDYRSALERFKAESRASIKTAQSRWIDSICYETMQGECYYQMGQYSDALLHYTAALELYQAFPTWLSQVVFQPIRADLSGKKPPPWQVRRLASPLGPVALHHALGAGQHRRLGGSSRRAGSSSRPTCFPSSPKRSCAARRWPSAAAASCSDRWPPTIR